MHRTNEELASALKRNILLNKASTMHFLDKAQLELIIYKTVF